MTPPPPGTVLEAELAAALAAEAAADPDDPAAVAQAAGRLYAARHALVTQWTPFACRKALAWWRSTGRRGEQDDWCSVAVLALMDAAGLVPPDTDNPRARRKKHGPNGGRYDPATGFAFPTYANWQLYKYLGDFAHLQRCGVVRVPKHKYALRQQPFPVTVSFSDVVSDLGGELATWEPTDRTQTAEQPPDEDAVWGAVARVITDPRDRLVVWLRFKRGWSYREIGQEIGISKQRVQQLLKRAMERLRAAGSVFAGVA